MGQNLSVLKIDLRDVKRHVSCEKCGCLVSLQNATSGEPFVKTKNKIYPQFFIYYPYYCKEHAPKIKEENNDESNDT